MIPLAFLLCSSCVGKDGNKSLKSGIALADPSMKGLCGCDTIRLAVQLLSFLGGIKKHDCSIALYLLDGQTGEKRLSRGEEEEDQPSEPVQGKQSSNKCQRASYRHTEMPKASLSRQPLKTTKCIRRRATRQKRADFKNRAW